MNINLGESISRLRKGRGLSQKELAQLLCLYGIDVSNQAVSKWEKNVSQPNATQFLVLCRVLNVDDISGEFLGRGQSAGLNREGREKLSEYAKLLRLSGLYTDAEKPVTRRVLPLYDLAVSAGTGQFLSDSSYELIDVPENVSEEADFGVRVAGDSMEPRYKNGSIVWVRKCETLSAGEVGVFVYDGNAYLKSLVWKGSRVCLRSLNPKYEDIDVRMDDSLFVLGKAL